jgi:hypothetical protein
MTIKNWHDRLETTMTAVAHITNHHLLPANHQVAQNSGGGSSVPFQKKDIRQNFLQFSFNPAFIYY